MNIAAAGSNSATSSPGTSGDGQLSSFLIGNQYTAADFARFTKLAKKSTTVRVLSGRACVQAGAKVSFIATGKCHLKVTAGKQSVRVVVTTY